MDTISYLICNLSTLGTTHILCVPNYRKKIKVMKHGRFLLNLRVFGSKPIKTRPKKFLQENLSKMSNLENLLIYLWKKISVWLIIAWLYLEVFLKLFHSFTFFVKAVSQLFPHFSNLCTWTTATYFQNSGYRLNKF